MFRVRKQSRPFVPHSAADNESVSELFQHRVCVQRCVQSSLFGDQLIDFQRE